MLDWKINLDNQIGLKRFEFPICKLKNKTKRKMKKHNGMRPQDIVILLYVLASNPKALNFPLKNKKIAQD